MLCYKYLMRKWANKLFKFYFSQLSELLDGALLSKLGEKKTYKLFNFLFISNILTIKHAPFIKIGDKIPKCNAEHFDTLPCV